MNDIETIQHKEAIIKSGKSVHSAIDPSGVLLVPGTHESTTTELKKPIDDPKSIKQSFDASDSKSSTDSSNKTTLSPYTKGSHSETMNATYNMQAPITNGKKLCCEKNEFMVGIGPGYLCTTCKKTVYSYGMNKSGKICGVVFV